MIRHALTYMKAYLGKYIKNEKGQAMVEYGLIIALIAVVVLGAVALIGTNLLGKFGEINEAIE